MNKIGVYKEGKVFYKENGETVSGTVDNRLDWWPSANQEVEFKHIGSYVRIVNLRGHLKPEKVELMYNV